MRYFCVGFLSLMLLWHGRIEAADKPYFENEGIGELAGMIDEVAVRVVDDVSDSCLAEPDSLKRAAELSLRKAGIHVVTSTPYTILINLVGYSHEIDSHPVGCTVHLNVRLQYVGPAVIPNGAGATAAGLIVVFDQGLMVTRRSKADLQAYLREKVTSTVEEIALSLYRSRQDVIPKYPSLKRSLDAVIPKS